MPSIPPYALSFQVEALVGDCIVCWLGTEALDSVIPEFDHANQDLLCDPQASYLIFLGLAFFLFLKKTFFLRSVLGSQHN